MTTDKLEPSLPNEPPREFEGLAPCLWPVAEAHGEDAVRFCIQLQVVQQAVQNCFVVMQNHRSTKGVMALSILGTSFNELAESYLTAKGWTTQELEAITGLCEVALRDAGPRIQLQ